MKVGSFELYLHWGHPPSWLVSKMIELSKTILNTIVENWGNRELLKRFADPLWFQAFSNAIGFDWNSSGSTTVTTYVIKKSLPEGFWGVGGKGKTSIEVPNQIRRILGEKGKKLERASKMVAKVDNSLVQDGYKLYHHFMVFDEKRRWCVIQQGLNFETKKARRYHWISSNLDSFVIEPHSGISGTKEQKVMDLTYKKNVKIQEAIMELVKEPKELKKEYIKIREKTGPLAKFFGDYLEVKLGKINWKAIKKAYNLDLKNFEDFVYLEGVGPETIRSLSLLSQLIYGTPIHWRDPCKFAFTVGGKDGVPYPINKDHYEKVIKYLKELVKLDLPWQEKIRIGKKIKRLEKLKAKQNT